MMTLAETIPKLPELLFMPRSKKPDPKNWTPSDISPRTLTENEYKERQREYKSRYFKKINPDPADRMTHQEFLQWGEAMGYSKGGVLIHYDKMAQDLGIQTTRVYAYWRGTDKGKELRPTLTITRLCDALMELKRRGKGQE